MLRAAGAALVVGLALAACSGDETDQPDVTGPLPSLAATVPPFADCSGDSPVDPCVTPTEPATTVSTDLGAASHDTPPATCGPDSDEQHPPPCD